MAALAVHDKAASDDAFIKFLPIIRRESIDERNFVKKAVNWALRQIEKRNRNLNRQAIETAREIQKLDSTSARWIAAEALIMSNVDLDPALEAASLENWLDEDNVR